mmetsp:Transcript_104276/g.300560  ORF Transcript_104276/g.300560 Transcript_104276/m.300560 type:complete len:670 (-) Transcript_104276:1991-4000(-)
MNSAKVQPITGEDGSPGVQASRQASRQAGSPPPSLEDTPVAARDEGGGEEKLPEGESPSRLTPVPGSATADVGTTSVAIEQVQTAAAIDTDESAGADTQGQDTHVVGFGGKSDDIIVVGKKMTIIRWMLLGSDEAVGVYNGYQKRYKLLVVYIILWAVATALLVIFYTYGIKDKRWYWLVVSGGVWLWLNMLLARNPKLLWRLFTNFDVLFNVSNMLVGSLCLGMSFGFDERAAAFLLIESPLLATSVLTDATMSSGEFKLRSYALLLGVLFLVSVIVLDFARLFDDTESVVLAWGTDGIWFTTAEAIGNTTSAASDAPWDVTRHTYLQPVSTTRFVLVCAYMSLDCWGSTTKPNECSILRHSTRRSVGGANFSLDERSGQGLEAPYEAPAGAAREENEALSPGQDREVAQEAERGIPVAPADAATRGGGTDRAGGTKTRGKRGKPTIVAKDAECRFDEMRLVGASEKGIQTLGDDEEVVVLMPGKGFVIPVGPKRTVLYWLCGDVGTTVNINGFLEGVKALLANLSAGAFLSILGMMEVVPYELTWLMILALPDALRKLFKLNAHAVSLVLRELDFWVPFVTMLLASFFASASFAHDRAAAAVIITSMVHYTVNVLLGKLPSYTERAALNCLLTDHAHTCTHSQPMPTWRRGRFGARHRGLSNIPSCF